MRSAVALDKIIRNFGLAYANLGRFRQVYAMLDRIVGFAASLKMILWNFSRANLVRFRQVCEIFGPVCGYFSLL